VRPPGRPALFFKFTADFFAEALGSKYSFHSYTAVFNKYWSVNNKQVLAYNVYLCGTGGDPPFYGNCIYGASNGLRDYTWVDASPATWLRRSWSIASPRRGDLAWLHSATWARLSPERVNYTGVNTSFPAAVAVCGSY
jgi:hypothetical protein